MTKPEPIVIDKIDHKKPVPTVIFDEILAGCYFYPIGDGTYILVSKFDMPLKSGISTGDDFVFDLGPFNWGVREFSITPEGAHGKWVANVPRLVPINPPGEGDADGEGSFQAQAGGHGAERYAAASSS
jgi:hypothetical protein